MSVIEQEQVQVEAPITEREQRARTLEAAALEIEVRGHVKGSRGMYPREGDGGVCLLGAIKCAMGRERDDDADWIEFAAVWGGGKSDLNLYAWNDHPDTTADQVIERLRSRAAQLRNNV